MSVLYLDITPAFMSCRYDLRHQMAYQITWHSCSSFGVILWAILDREFNQICDTPTR
jgi:hypothetical protein